MDGRDAGLQSSRPELMAWWKQLEALQDAPVAHHDGNDVALVNVGGDDASGFVQVARTRDPSGRSMRDVVVGTLESLIARRRPDVLGGMLARAEDGAVTQVIYFGSEDEAREHEARPIPDEDAEASRRLWGDPAAGSTTSVCGPRYWSPPEGPAGGHPARDRAPAAWQRLSRR